jgi:predicted ribosomally synthesized peptide with SipW-like signal peptide
MVVAAALSVGALGLVGVGTGATFTDAVHNSQQVTAGTLDVQLAADGATGALSTDGKTFTFPAAGPVTSDWTSGPQALFINNMGTIPAKAITLSASETHNADSQSASLLSEMWVKIYSWSAPNTPVLVVDEPLSTLLSHPIAISGAIPAPGQDWFSTEFHAPAAGFTNPSEGGVVTPSVTVSYEG